MDEEAAARARRSGGLLPDPVRVRRVGADEVGVVLVEVEIEAAGFRRFQQEALVAILCLEIGYVQPDFAVDLRLNAWTVVRLAT